MNILLFGLPKSIEVNHLFLSGNEFFLIAARRVIAPH
jgi:hypothetical protein